MTSNDCICVLGQDIQLDCVNAFRDVLVPSKLQSCQHKLSARMVSVVA